MANQLGIGIGQDLLVGAVAVGADLAQQRQLIGREVGDQPGGLAARRLAVEVAHYSLQPRQQLPF